MSAPSGVTFTTTPDSLILRATTRSWGALVAVPFMCVWTVLSMGGIFWSRIERHEFIIALTVIGIPFILITLCFWWFVLLMVFGKIEVRISGDEGRIFTGIGSAGWTRRFKPADIVDVRFIDDSDGGEIVLAGTKRLSFGVLLTGDRKRYVADVLRVFLTARSTQR